MQNIIVLINYNPGTAWCTKIIMPLFSFLDNLLQDACIIFQNSVDSFEIVDKTCSNFGLGCLSSLMDHII